MIVGSARDPQFEVRLRQGAARERLNRNYVKHIADCDEKIDWEAGFILVRLSNIEGDLIAIERKFRIVAIEAEVTVEVQFAPELIEDSVLVGEFLCLGHDVEKILHQHGLDISLAIWLTERVEIIKHKGLINRSPTGLIHSDRAQRLCVQLSLMLPL